MARFLSAFLLSCLLAQGSHIADVPDRVFILTVAPPEVVTVDASRFAILGHTRLPAPPAAVALPGTSGVLYFLVNGATNADGSLPKGPSEVVAFDTASNRILRSLEVGWAASRIAITDDGRFLFSFRDRSPGRVFESAPSLAGGLFALVKQSKLSRKSSAICAIDRVTLDVVWREEIDHNDRNVLYSRALQRFCIHDRERTVKIVDIAGGAATLELPPRNGKRTYGLSPSGRWLYVLEDGKDAPVKAERINGRIFVVDVATGALSATLAVENEPLRFEDAIADRVAVATRTGVVRTFTGSDVTSVTQAGRHFRFARAFDNNGVLHVGKDRLTFYSASKDAPAWTIDWHDRLHGEPGGDFVRVPNSQVIAVPVMTFNRGPDLDRVAFVDTRSAAAAESVPVGRRGRMLAKSLGEVAAGALSSPSAWSGLGSGCCLSPGAIWR